MAGKGLYPEPTGEVRMSLSLRFAAGSHKGMIREGNEDSGYAGPRLLAIADGMGGQAAGEVASSEVISTLVQLDDDVPGSDILTSLGTAVQRANDQLRVMVEQDPQLEGMGTTLTALLWTGQRLGLVHVGDSRAYLLRDGVLTQITQDHTWVQRLVDEGRITEEEATTHPQRSLLMRALGSGDHVEPDLSIREVRAGDRYLICSDGLSGVVSHQTMEETLASYQGPHETIQELIQLALRGGGPDNITCIVADVLDVDGGDTLAQQLNDTPVIVGAVAENQLQLGVDGAMQTPAGRAAEHARANRPVPSQQPGGAFGPPGSGDGGMGGAPDGSFGAFMDEDFVKEPRRGRWLKRTLILGVVLGVVAGGLYGGYSWTQTQYYVGAKDNNHVAVYQGINQDLAWVSLSKLYQDHPEIELKYLPVDQRSRVEDTIALDSREKAEQKAKDLGLLAGACKKEDERRKAEQAQRDREKQNGDRVGSVGDLPKDPKDPKDAKPGGAGLSAQATPVPSPGPTLTEEEQKLVPQCSAQQ
ncbi:Stp1/IreP family PP2C-type Ser/Thr phosphatase [Streptosporangium nondiastaticum]|uniref:Serine/threonine protein phosphatase PstP n=1 Tax=Streptosporangium nondiastaticum TaxID=35764 RepID=A0A9X7PI39_9ACTN|nr:Stp1/IreP family PP2C-type Ser/Thr phosphatase [Streptosporangium nondiastaticum]PSJ28717.1 Stp1/IreP family PP2C-type Ser/Thr phosphatase [Streptosporangium nondiastaticum]